ACSSPAQAQRQCYLILGHRVNHRANAEVAVDAPQIGVIESEAGRGVAEQILHRAPRKRIPPEAGIEERDRVAHRRRPGPDDRGDTPHRMGRNGGMGNHSVSAGARLRVRREDPQNNQGGGQCGLSAHGTSPYPYGCSLRLWRFNVIPRTGRGRTCSAGSSRRRKGRPAWEKRVALPAGGGLCYNHGALWKTGGSPRTAEAGKTSKRRRQRRNHRSTVQRVPRRSSRTSASWFADAAAIICPARTTTDGNPGRVSSGASGWRDGGGGTAIRGNAGSGRCRENNRKGGSERATEDCEQR